MVVYLTVEKNLKLKYRFLGAPGTRAFVQVLPMTSAEVEHDFAPIWGSSHSGSFSYTETYTVRITISTRRDSELQLQLRQRRRFGYDSRHGRTHMRISRTEGRKTMGTYGVLRPGERRSGIPSRSDEPKSARSPSFEWLGTDSRYGDNGGKSAASATAELTGYAHHIHPNNARRHYPRFTTRRCCSNARRGKCRQTDSLQALLLPRASPSKLGPIRCSYLSFSLLLPIPPIVARRLLSGCGVDNRAPAHR